MSSQEIQVPGWPAPRGFANGRIGRGSVVHVAGQIGVDQHGGIDERSEVAGGGDPDGSAGGAGVLPRGNESGFTPQFARALDNVIAVVRAAGGVPEDIATMTVFVTDISAYRGALKELGAAWRERLGKHFPAMALVAVTALVEPRAVVEIQATAYVEAP
jgi:enamine deaminase RidA (YjgF/YER057c/UK114 family)